MIRAQHYQAFTWIVAMLLFCGVLQAAETRIGVISLDSAQTEKLVPLMELHLSKDPKVVLVERNAIDAVLREQQLQAMLAADAPGKRAALGKILKADLLVFLAGRDKPKPHVTVVVCETTQGVRLCSEHVSVMGNSDADVRAVLRQVDAAIRKQREKIVDIVAVPILVNNSLTYYGDKFQTPFTRLVENSLLNCPGVLVVELAEAKALAREIAISGSVGIERRLPLYLMGEYRFDGSDETRRARFAWKLLRGEKLLGECAEKDMAEETLPERLNQAALDLVEKASGQPENRFDPAVEAEQLAQRSRVFRNLGMWRESLSMSEASLLLKPDQPALHGDALLAMLEINEARVWMKGALDRGAAVEQTIEAMHWLREALPHLEAFFRGTKITRGDSWYVRTGLDGFFKVHPDLDDLTPPELLASCAELYRARKEAAQRIIAYKIEARVADDSLVLLLNWIDPPLDPNRNFQYFRAFLGSEYHRLSEDEKNAWFKNKLAQVCENRLRLLQDVVWMKPPSPEFTFGSLVCIPQVETLEPVYLAFLEKVEKLPNAAMSQAATQCRERYLAETKQREEQAKWMREPKANNLATRVIITVPGTGNNMGSQGFFATAKAKPTWPMNVSAAVFHPVNIAGVSCPWAFFPAGNECDCICDDGQLALMKKKGQLHTLPLTIGCSHIATPGGGQRLDLLRGMHNICWDGEYVWALNPGKNGPLVVLEPQEETIWKLDDDGGLPPSTSCAIAPLGPGKICVAGYFGRLWIALATFDPRSGIKLEVIHEARTVFDVLHKVTYDTIDTQDASVAYPISFMATLNSHAAGQAPAQRVVVGRDQIGPLVVDPEKRAVTFAPFHIGPKWFAYEDAIYWQDRTCSTSGPTKGFDTKLFRFGFPDFKKEDFDAHFVLGECILFTDRFHMIGSRYEGFWTTSYYTASSIHGSAIRMQCDAPRGSGFAKSEFFLSNHYGLLLSTTTGLYQVELKTP